MSLIKENALIISVILFFVLLFAFTKILGPIPFTVNNFNTNNSIPFETQGTGKASAPPDKALINLGVTSSAPNVEAAQDATNASAERIIEGLKELEIDEKDIKTTNYSITPNYDFSEGSQEITGYTVAQNLEVKTPIDLVNEAVDSATSNGANLVGNISFTLDDEKEAELKNTARKEAVAKAKESAEGLAKASGIRLGKIINVRESFSGETPPPIAFDTREVGTPEEQIQTNITPGESNVEVTVTLTYETL